MLPGIVLVHLVTARTLNTAWGWYTISITFSVSSVCVSKVSLRLPVISDSLTKNEYGTLSSWVEKTKKPFTIRKIISEFNLYS